MKTQADLVSFPQYQEDNTPDNLRLALPKCQALMAFINAQSVQLFGILFLGTSLYALYKIGLRRFRYYDVYKLIYPIFLIIYLRDEKNLKSFIIAILNILMVVCIILFFSRGQTGHSCFCWIFSQVSLFAPGELLTCILFIS